MQGWIKIHRKMTEKGYYHDSEYVHLWLHLLLSANHEYREFMWNGEMMKLQPGQLITGRKALSKETGIDENKIERALKTFESEQQIEQQKTNRFRLITVKKWSRYQMTEQQIEQPVNNKRTTSEQPVNTNKNVRIKELKNNTNTVRFAHPTLEEVKAYCLERKNSVNPNKWFSYYESNGWRVGRNPMKDWQAAVRTWEESKPKRKTIRL